MTITWYDFYESKVRRDASPRTAVRFIRLHSPDGSTTFTQENVFDDTVSGTMAATEPPGGIPQRGDTYPGDNALICGSREVASIRGPSDIVVRLDYSQVSTGSIDPYFTGDPDSNTPPHIEVFVTGAKEEDSVPRVVAYPFTESGDTIYNYAIVNEPRIRTRSTITATLHLTSWTAMQTFQCEDQYGSIHTDISFIGPGYSLAAMFTSANITRLGDRLYRITYTWDRQSSLEGRPETTLDVPGNTNPVRLLEVPIVDPHTNLTVFRRPFETISQSSGLVQLDAEPLLVNAEPVADRIEGTTSMLPGLEHAGLSI